MAKPIQKLIVNRMDKITSGKVFPKKATTSTSTAETPSSGGGLPTRDLVRVERLFKHFSARYNYLWNNNFKSAEVTEFIKNEWAIALKNVSDQQMKHALDRSLREHKRPPSLPEFLELCRIGHPAAFYQGFNRVKIDRPKSTPETVRKHLADIKKILH